MKKRLMSSTIFLYVGSGLLLALGSNYSWFFWGGVVGLSLFLYALTKTLSWRMVALGSLLTGVLKAAGGTFGITSIYPITTLGFDPSLLTTLVLGGYWLVVSVSMALGVVCVGLLVWYGCKKSTYALWLFPVAWLLGEIVGSYAFSVLMLGPGSSINSSFAMGHVGVSLSGVQALFPIMSVAGLYGASVSAAWLGLLLYSFRKDAVYHRYRVCMLAGTIAVLVLGNVAVPTPSAESLNTTVVTVDTVFGNDMKTSDKRQQVVAAMHEVLAVPSDIVLFPEDTRFTTMFDSTNDALVYLKGASDGRQKLVVDSARITLGDGSVVFRVFYYDLVLDEVYEIDKQYLVPQGEYVPYWIDSMLTLTDNHSALEALERNQKYIPGPMANYAQFPEDTPGVLFCFDSVVPNQARKLSGERSSTLILHPASHGWFNEPDEFWYQLDALLRVQAVYSGKHIVQAGNLLSGKTYYNNGHIEYGTTISQGEYWKLIEYTF